MKRLSAPIVLALLLWGAATFGLAVLAAEWRQDEPDLSPLSRDISNLRDDVRELRASGEAVDALQTEVAGLQRSVDQVRGILGLPLLAETPTPTPIPTPTPTPTVAEAKRGVVVELPGMRLTIEHVSPASMGGEIDFILENIDAPPEETAGFAASAVAQGGFVCFTHVDGYPPLEPGQKVRFFVSWNCEGPPIETLTLDGAIAFQFP